MNIATIIKRIAEGLIRNEEFYSLVCKVDSVDVTEGTIECSPVNGDAELKGTRIQASLNSTGVGIFIKPTLNSHVVVTFLNKDAAFVSLYTEVDEIIFNGGSNDGLIKINELKTQIDKNTALLQAIQDNFTSWTPVPNDGGLALKALSSNFVSLARANLSNIENDKIKH